ncbi:olfactory receptor 52M1 [Alligator mississippiensis]|uniref:Olfactory receptor 52M1 n=1 Tax=Alligator mississippiensis TaxID=8496 RepID=A0A151M1B1_ALLMI|nr:olfactory receptor 52M1 [Alligator mississippiensis]KYO18308.1 olfactory receptor 52M1 [Alligator mississippiensis]
MLTFSNTCFSPSSFFLTGIPELETTHLWISIPFCSMYIIAILGNFTILFIVKAEQSLHEPMYIFLCMLAVIDLVLSTSTMPKLLSIFWFNTQEINVHACLLQMFFIHSFATIESGIFLAMAYDRYVAICNPLRHKAILTHSIIAKIGLMAVIRGVLYIAPLPLLIKRLTYFRTNVIAHSYCEHMAVVMLACEDITVNNLYGMTIGFLVLIGDSLCIAFSYAMIFRTVFSLSTLEARLKSISTCSSHICAILVFYIPIAVSSLTHRFGWHVAPPIHILLANFYLIIPPVLNPIVYAVRTKEIRRRLYKLLYSNGLVQKQHTLQKPG